MVVRWTFYDPSGPETYTFEINPISHKPGDFEKNVTTQGTTAPGDEGRTIAMEGTDVPRKGNFSGNLSTQTHYEAFENWYKHRNQIKLTDDLGREQWIIILRFAPTRVHKARKPWRHSFDVDYLVLEGWSP